MLQAFQVIGRDGLWEFDGMSEPSVSYKGNSLKTKAKGYRIVRFRDGTSIEILYPSYYLRCDLSHLLTTLSICVSYIPIYFILLR